MFEEAIPARREVEPGRFLLEYPSLTSTQDVARQLAAQCDSSVIGVRTDFQSEGRGRRGAAWMAPPDSCLLITYILTPFHARDAAQLSFAAGVAVARAIREVCGLDANLKWPNDVLVNGRKAAGILIETAENAALAGMGLNVNVAAFPSDLESSATSLLLETGREWSIQETESSLRSHLFRLATEPWSAVLSLWRELDDTKGRHYRTVVDGGECEGIAHSVNDDGALVLQLTDGQMVAVLAATSS